MRLHAPRPEVVGEVQAHVVRVVVAGHPLVAGDGVPALRVDRLWQFVVRDVPLPLVVAAPARHRPPAVGLAPHRDQPLVQVPEVPLHVAHGVVVDAVGPVAEGVVKIGDALRPHGVAGGVQPGGAFPQAGVADGDAVPLGRIPGDHGSVMGDGDLRGLAASPANVDRLAHDLGRQPLALELVLPSPGRLAEPLDEQVLRVGAAVGHAPGHALVVAEVEGPRHARHGVADDVIPGTGQVHLVVDGGHVQAAVGIARHQGKARFGQSAGDRPAVGADLGLAEPVGLPRRGVEGLQAVENRPLVLGPGRDGEQIAARVPLH